MSDKISKGLDIGQNTGMILIDLQKTFDTIDHGLLLKKMPHIGFSTKSVDWFRSYLSNRTFIVNIDKSFSELAKLTCGVP